MKIVVLAGGISTEREVSLVSGRNMTKALKELGHQAILVDVFMGLEKVPDSIDALFEAEQPIDLAAIGTKAPDLCTLRKARGESSMGEMGEHVLDVCRAADLVYLGLHGENGENGRLQALFDVVGIRYTGSGYLGSALAMDKWRTKQILLQEGLPTPKGALAKTKEEAANAGIGLPCVIKPKAGGSSIGVSIVHSKAQWDQALDQAFAWGDDVLLEEYIKGREFSVGILGDQVLPIIEIIPKTGFYDYENKYQAGATEEICPARLSEKETQTMQCLAKQVYDALGLQVYGRVDFLLDETGRMVCLEANTLPGMTPTSLIPQEAAAAGISYGALCQKVIDLSLAKYERKE